MHYRPITPLPVVHDWLVSERTAANRYAHHLLLEVAAYRDAAQFALRDIIAQISEDVRARLRLATVASLDPFDEEHCVDPARGYPSYLDIITLKGYFGEVLSGLLAVTVGSHDVHTWEVPAFLMRFHEAAFQYLERQQQANPDGDPDLQVIDSEARIPGRTGDDCLAFQRDAHGQIVRVLCCEAKCTLDHASGLVADAHTKASEATLKPVDLRQLIELLADYDDQEALAWRNALIRLRFSQELPNHYERCDLICYVHGRRPVRNHTWLSVTTPHPRYTARRRLEVLEVWLSEVTALVIALYRQVPVERQ